MERRRVGDQDKKGRTPCELTYSRDDFPSVFFRNKGGTRKENGGFSIDLVEIFPQRERRFLFALSSLSRKSCGKFVRVPRGCVVLRVVW